MKLYKLFWVLLGVSLACSMSAKDLNQARIYINPGHGGWGPNDRPLATINYARLDTLGFFETNTDLIKGFSLYDELTKAGAGFVKMSRTKNGIVALNDPYKTPNDEYEGNGQIVTLSVITQDVEENNMDYFISIHSNANIDGDMTNYPLLLYRGTDAAPGNGLIEAKNMAIDAWKYIANNGVTYYSAHTGATANNNRGDISFQGSPSGGGPYIGYYGVLKHGCDGFLSEGCFHTYQPERHRLLNDDYCRQEGLRYARAIRAWFGDKTETKGAIMGSVKDISKPLEHPLYTYKINSIDAYYPLNNVTVILQDSKGVELKRYTTDKEYNGIFVFTDLEPGTYKILYDIAGYWKEMEEIEVVANETSFTNKRLTDTSKEEPSEEKVLEVEYYIHPEQDGDIAAAAYYNFMKEYELKDVAPLKDLIIRRAILRDNKYYVLAVDGDAKPKLMVLDPTTGALLKNMSTDGVITEGFQGKKFPYILSDITFTNDGVLLATNSTVIGRENNGFQTGDFYMYKWQATDGVVLEDATPQILLTLPTNTSASLLAVGNNFSNFVANSIAVNGNSDNFKFYFDSHAGGGWNSTFGMKYVCWVVENGVVAGTQFNNSDFNESQVGADVKMTLSPLGLDRFILDGNKIAPREFEIDWQSNTLKKVADFSGNIPIESMGANYFRYANKIYMSTPVCTKEGDKYSYKSHLFDITEGIDKAKSIGMKEVAITDQPALTYMTSTGVVDNADIDQYLLVGTNIVKYTTKGEVQAESPARIFAYNLVSTATNSGYDISYELNEKAESVVLIFTNSESGEEIKTMELSAGAKGKNTQSIAKSDVPSGMTCTWSLQVSAGNVTRFTKLSDDSNAYRFFAPKGVGIDKSPESPYFGRVYVTNTASGETAGRTTATGLYVLGADGSDITNQGNTPYTGGIAWTGTNAEGPRKAAVASDGRVFIADASTTNAGIYMMNPATFAIASIFKGATNTAGKLTINGTYVGGQMTAVGVRGTGANTQLYAVDKTASGASWKKFVNVYNIGEANTWTAAPSYSAAASSYIGNDNNSISPVSTGYWAGQFRGAPTGNTPANPCIFYYSDEYKEAVFNTAEPNIISTSSQNGGLAVNEGEGTIALSNDGGLSIFHYKMKKDGIPNVIEKFKNSLSTTGMTYDDFEFDYAGNLYAVSHSGKLISVWAMPTDNNSCVIPAQKSMTMTSELVSIEETSNETIRIYPNPTTDIITIELPNTINSVEVYNVSGLLVQKMANINSRSTTVDFSDFPQGVYLVKVNNGESVRVIRK